MKSGERYLGLLVAERHVDHVIAGIGVLPRNSRSLEHIHPHPYTYIRHTYTYTRHTYTYIRHTYTYIRHTYTYIRHTYTYIRHTYTYIRHTYTYIRHTYTYMRNIAHTYKQHTIHVHYIHTRLLNITQYTYRHNCMHAIVHTTDHTRAFDQWDHACTHTSSKKHTTVPL